MLIPTNTNNLDDDLYLKLPLPLRQSINQALRDNWNIKDPTARFINTLTYRLLHQATQVISSHAN